MIFAVSPGAVLIDCGNVRRNIEIEQLDSSELLIYHVRERISVKAVEIHPASVDEHFIVDAPFEIAAPAAELVNGRIARRAERKIELFRICGNGGLHRGDLGNIDGGIRSRVIDRFDRMRAAHSRRVFGLFAARADQLH